MANKQQFGTEEINTLTTSAWNLRSQDPQQALAVSLEAVTLARSGEHWACLAPALCMQGICLDILSRYEDARVPLTESLLLSRQTGDFATEARSLHFLGDIHYCLTEHAEAIDKVTASLHIREGLGDTEGVGACFNTLGNIQLGLCDYGQALSWYTRSLEARERAGDLEGITAVLNNIGLVYQGEGDLSQAVHYHQRSLDQAVRIGSTALESTSLCNLGGDYTEMRRYGEAIEVCRRSVRLGEALEDWESVAAALTSLGHAYGKTNRPEEALECHARALKIAQSTGDQKMVAYALYSAGGVRAGQGELAEARKQLAQASALARRIGARHTALLAFQLLSEVCKRQGDYAAALGHHETFQRLEKEVFTEESADRAKALVIKMEVEHHRREAETLSEINAALQAANARLEALAVTDPLTRLPNHRALVAALDAAVARARRSGEPCALLFLDIDHFKSVNDTYGHPVGDAVLREFAACVRAALREEDTLGRWGGEEFLALLPGTNLAEALQVAERVRTAVAGCVLSAGMPQHTERLHMTCSVGASACPPEDAERDALVEAADRALYAAKRLGRNQVRSMSDPAILALDGPLFPSRIRRPV